MVIAHHPSPATPIEDLIDQLPTGQLSPLADVHIRHAWRLMAEHPPGTRSLEIKRSIEFHQTACRLLKSAAALRQRGR